MGVVNVTPDSFSDGGATWTRRRPWPTGCSWPPRADLLDVGGESTRPGAVDVAEAVELDRVLPVIEELAQKAEVPISVDTRKAVAAAAVAAGASMVNDVSAGRHDPDLLGVVAEAKVPLVLMHMLGTPATMQDDPRAMTTWSPRSRRSWPSAAWPPSSPGSTRIPWSSTLGSGSASATATTTPCSTAWPPHPPGPPRARRDQP